MLSLLLVIYYGAALLFYLVVRGRGKAISIGISAFLLFVPLAGLPLAILSLLASRKPSEDDGERFVEVIDMQTGGGNLLGRIDVAKEADTIPVEEALAVNDHRTRRRVVLDTLKTDVMKMVPVLSKAMRNEDTETSHYAVAAIMELKRTMLAELQKQTVALERSPHDELLLAEAASVLKRYLDSGLMDARMERTYRRLQADVLERLVASSRREPQHFEDKVECEIELGRYDRAREACERYAEEFPESEAAYYVQLKLWYTIRASSRFASTLDSLKRSQIKVSQRTLTLIRYWSAGV